MSPLVALFLAVGLAAVHVFAGRLRGLRTIPRSRWLSLGGGISVAYVFVHVFPEITERHVQLTGGGEGEHAGEFVAAFAHHAVFLSALVGFTAFYGLEQLAHHSRREAERGEVSERAKTLTTERVFWVHVGSFAAYNAVIGYLLLHREEAGVWSLAFYVTAMAVHFVVNDYGLREHHRDAYDRVGRWVLAGAVVVGVLVGAFVGVPESVLTLLFAVLAGGVVFNVIKEELPEERESRFWTFAAGLTGYTAVLLLA